jgi:hypothetical protein
LYTLLLFASWNFNLFGVPSGVIWYQVEPRAGSFGTDSYLVLNRLAHGAAGGPGWSPLVMDCDRGQYYTSQFGLQGIALSGLQRALGAAPGQLAAAASAGFCLLTAFVFASVFAVAGRRFGRLAGDVAAVLAAPAPVMLAFAPSLYWATFLLVGPFALVWAFGGSVAGSGRAWGGLLLAFGLVVFAKCLCGYEYVTAVAGGGVAALWYHQQAAGVPAGRRWRAAGALAGAGLAGFALAVACHAAQLSFVVGVDPVETIRTRAEARTAGDWRAEDRRPFPADWFPFLPEDYAYPANCFVDYFRQPVVAAPAGWSRRSARRLPLGAPAAGAVAAAVALGRRRPAAGLAGALALALAAGASWQVLAVNHMCTQSNLNLIVYQIGFVPLGLVAIGCAVSAACRRDGVRTAASAGLAVGVAVAAGLSLRSAARQSQEAADAEAGAVAVVWSHLAGGAAPVANAVECRVDHIGTEPGLHPSLVVELGWTRVIAPDGTGEPTVFVGGWAVDRSGAREYRAPRVVVAVGGRVVPATVVRYGRPDLDRLAGRPAPGSAFLVAIPKHQLPEGARPRVYAVSSADPFRFSEASYP